MQNTEQILQAMQKLGKKGLPLTRVYRCLFSEDLFLTAYDRIGRNTGSLTPGTANDTVDGMSMATIRSIIEQLRYERFHFRPSRRTQVPKKRGGTRPLGVPDFPEKLVQEALRLMLEAYYEPRFRNSSHGFRSERGCHSALAYIQRKFQGTTWFIEGDIRGCFDNIDHEVLMGILARDIQDGRLLNLIRRCLAAGYLDEWVYHRTHSGTPQGSIVSPLLANIYLHELDAFVEDVLIPKYTSGARRADNPRYRQISHQIKRARQRGDDAVLHRLELERRQIPSYDVNDPNFRRLHYCRYADDFVLGFTGPKSEAREIKEAVGKFLWERLHLEMHQEKTFITHAKTEKARFLNYAISVYQVNDKVTRAKGKLTRARSINGGIRLGIPQGLIDEKCKAYQKNGKPTHETILIDSTDAEIIDTYQERFRGIANYYKYAVDRYQLDKLKYVMEAALTKTLARKLRTSVTAIYRKYKGTHSVNGRSYKTLQVQVPTSKEVRTIYWGAIPLTTVKPGTEPIKDEIRFDQITRSDLIQRLQAEQCELCGSQQDCEVHHVRKLSDLKKRWKGKREKPEWVVRMIARRRKTLVVCRACHVNIHSKTATSQPKHTNSGEPDDAKVSRPVRRGVYGKVPTN